MAKRLSLHCGDNIFKERELSHEGVVATLAITTADGKSYRVVKEYLTTAVIGKSYCSGEQTGNSFQALHKVL